MSDSPQTDGVTRFSHDSNPTGIACRMIDGQTEYVVLAPSLTVLKRLMQRLAPKTILDPNKCKAATLNPYTP